MVLLSGKSRLNYVAVNIIKVLTVVGKDCYGSTRTEEERVDAASSRRLIEVQANTIIIAVCIFHE